jgi:hypothetical protein
VPAEIEDGVLGTADLAEVIVKMVHAEFGREPTTELLAATGEGLNR